MNYIKAIQEAEAEIKRLNSCLERERRPRAENSEEQRQRLHRTTMLEEMLMEQESNLKLFKRRVDE